MLFRSSPLCSALSLPDCLKTQQSLWVWFACFPGVLWIWHILSKILFRFDSSSLLSLRGSVLLFCRELLNLALTAVLFGLFPLVRRWSLLRRGFPFPSLTLDVLGSLVLHLASQLSSPAQKRVMSLVNAAIVLGLSYPRCLASHSSRTLCLKAAKALAFGQSTIWYFLVRNVFQSFRADSPGYLVIRLKSSPSRGRT